MELRMESVEPLQEEKALIENHISQINIILEKSKKDELNMLNKPEATSKELTSISEQKERLIEDIRIHSIVNGTSGMKLEKLITYEEQIYEANKRDPYNDLNEFIILGKG